MLSYCSELWSRQFGRISKLCKTKTTSSSILELLPTRDSEKLQKDLDLMLSSLANKQTCDQQGNTSKIRSMQISDQGPDAGYSLHEALYGLFEKIQQATQRSLDNQRVDPSMRLQHQLDIASLGALVDRMNKQRLIGQEWISNSEQLSIDIAELVAKSSCFFKIESEYDEQRYELSPIKERDLFLFHIFTKINRQSARRMANQDAEIKPRRKTYEEEDQDELFLLIQRVSSSNKRYADQRAIMKRCP